MAYCVDYRSPVGDYTMASDGEAIIGLWRRDQAYFGMGAPDTLEKKPELPVFSLALDWLERYFAGERPDALKLPLSPRGSAYRQAVWAALRGIPYGETVTYGEVAARAAAMLGADTASARAAGGAIGHNPISIIIPCHRVCGADGSMTGYAGGVSVKIELLRHEGVSVSAGLTPRAGVCYT